MEKIKDPAQLSCFLGERCGARTDVSGPGVAGGGTGRAWTAEDFAKANAQERNRNLAPGGKLDRGIPDLKGVASEVVANSPLGPLTGNPPDKGSSPARTAAELALATAGGLLLFGGLGGKKLGETIPGIRKAMAMGAVILGLSGASALALSEMSLPAISLGGAAPAPQLALAGGGALGSGAGLSIGEAGVGALKVGTMVGGAKVASDLYSYSMTQMTGKGSAGSGKGTPKYEKMTVSEALDRAQQRVGKDAVQIDEGVYQNRAGTRQFRMTRSDLSGHKAHHQFSHVHFETLQPNGVPVSDAIGILIDP